MEAASVVIAGAGPVGLTLALELERHGVDTLLVERSDSTTRHPKMDITNGRSMELYRRLGIAEELRKVAVSADRRTKVTWATNAVGWELASFEYPAVNEAYEEIRERNDGTLSLEPPMRVSQIVLEPALRRALEERAEHVRVSFGWELERFEQLDDCVIAHLGSARSGERRTVRAEYLAGCDGAGSRVRRQLGIALDSVDLRGLLLKEFGPAHAAAALIRDVLANRRRPMDGRFYLVHFTSRDRRIRDRFGPIWHLQSPEGWTVISQDDGDTWTLHAPLGIGMDSQRIDPRQFVHERLGFKFDLDVLVANAWTPRLAVADSYGGGRVWLAGDAVHQVTPAGGYGMNTGVGDAVALGWVLAAQLQGWGTAGLLTSYERERRSVALRNREASGRHSLVRAAVMAASRPAMHSERWLGDRTRRRLGRGIEDLGNLENEALGIELGYRYDGSPAVCHEPDVRPPSQRMDEYVPSTWPGARPPSVRLADGRELFDFFHVGFTLLRFAELDVDDFVRAAARRKVPLAVIDVREPHARRLYERDLVLIRPDQHVAWRGDTPPDDPYYVIDHVRGAHAGAN